MDWPYKNRSIDSSLIYLHWADFISVFQPEWLSLADFHSVKKRKKKVCYLFQIITKVKKVFPSSSSHLSFTVQPRAHSSLTSHAFIFHLLRNVLRSSWVRFNVLTHISIVQLQFSRLLIHFLVLIWGCNKHFEWQRWKMCHLHILKHLFFQMCFWKQQTPSSDLLWLKLVYL